MANQVASLRMEQKFKKTPAGDIPVDWEARTLGELCLRTPEYGANVSAIEFRPEWPRYVRITDIDEAGFLSSADRKSIKVEDAKPYLLGEGDIIFARSGATVGKTYLYQKADGPCAFAGYTIRFSPNPQCLLPEFLAQFTHSQLYYQWVKGILRAGAQPNINGSEYSGLFLPIPPLREQKKIAEILSAVDEAIEKTNTVIGKMKEVKKGLTQGLLVHGIRHKKLKKTPLGNIPIEWEIKKLGDLCIGSPEYGANVAGRDYVKGSPRYIRITDIADNGYLADNGPKTISNEDAQSYMLSVGDLLFARSGATVGKTYLYQKSDGSCAFAGYLIRFKPNPQKLLPEYLFQVTHSEPYYRWVKGMLRAGAQPNINATEYADLRLAVPPVSEQKKLLTILMGTDDAVSQEQKYKECMENTKRGLLNMLLTGKVRA